MLNADQALLCLQEGNRRFLAGEGGRANHQELAPLASGQSPHAILLGCSDSRVAPEVLFDQALGEVFVARVAGHVPSTEVIGSIEFAVAHFGTPLLVVLGHSGCGAVRATLDQLSAPSANLTLPLRSLTDAISPSIQPLLENNPWEGQADLLDQAVRSNVTASVEQLQTQPGAVATAAERGQLHIVGAHYELQTGEVQWLAPDSSRKG